MNFYLLPADVREEIPGPISLETDIWTSGTPCYVEIGIREASVTDVPPTFLLDDGDEDTPAEMPFGGQLLDDVNVDGNPSGEGPHPFYLYDGTAFPGLRAQFERLVVTGVHVKVVVDP